MFKCVTQELLMEVSSLHLLKPPDFMKANRVKYVAQEPFMEQVILTFSGPHDFMILGLSNTCFCFVLQNHMSFLIGCF